MKKKLLILLLLFGAAQLATAQGTIIGIQNSPRKSMISSIMNPAEINNLDKKVEVNFFSINGSVNNNTISYGDILEFGEDVIDVAFQGANGPVNMRTDASILGPSIGIKSGKWAFGFSTQAFLRADIIDLDPTLGQSILDIAFESSNSMTAISSEYNQRVNAAGWAEMGFLLGREIINTEKHKFSIGATAKLLFPGSYANFGLDRLSAVIVQDEFEVSLTEATGTLNLSYSEADFDGSSFGLGTDGFNFGKVNGVGFDFGGNYLLKDAEGRSKLNLGLSVRNLGSMRFAEGQVNNTYSMNIPEGEFFSLDQLSDNLDEVEQQLLASGYFTKTTETDGIKTNLPSIVSGYAELKLLKKLYLSAYGQVRTGDDFANETITAQNLFVITPRLVLGKFEVYSPWTKTEVSGYAGGLGLRFGGFFVGSNSILTGLTADTKQADFHVGLSWGFGRYN
ncbi:hypothetical protein Belba_3469 [Belliella baltica DSM 15883]|uniref:Uncharacterized protein n=1 Tax=Belliella baltica (strain DSM 15883 / CIP 108006 / LMG 21964 / BA134) TaxID=866536 RepID=I3Z9Q3_BELBD|nr:hypothetical protein [Belliella baltica]AFL85971.1 hypothetical protein Belba_3469 [Belliella baltica DSM 15883]